MPEATQEVQLTCKCPCCEFNDFIEGVPNIPEQINDAREELLRRHSLSECPANVAIELEKMSY